MQHRFLSAVPERLVTERLVLEPLHPSHAPEMVAWLHGAGVPAVSAHIHPENRPSEALACALGLAPTSTTKAGEVRWEAALERE